MLTTQPGDSKNEITRDVIKVGQGFVETPEDGDSVGLGIEDFSGIPPCLFAVDYREDFKLLPLADQAAGCFAVLLSEIAFAIDDGGLGSNVVAIGRGGGFFVKGDWDGDGVKEC